MSRWSSSIGLQLVQLCSTILFYLCPVESYVFFTVRENLLIGLVLYWVLVLGLILEVVCILTIALNSERIYFKYFMGVSLVKAASFISKF